MKCYVKRIIDIILSVFGIIVFLPAWIIVSFLIKIDSKGTVLYKHIRVGLNGKKFFCFKFRSMHENIDPDLLPQNPSDKRVAKVGRFLRKTSLDETPQLINVLFGDMSIVGQRP